MIVVNILGPIETFIYTTNLLPLRNKACFV